MVKIPDPGDLIPFDDFRVKVKIHKRIDFFKASGLFTLSELFSDGIDPVNEELTLRFVDPAGDKFELVIPARSFRKRGRRSYKFFGVVDGVVKDVKVFAFLHEFRGDKWYFNIRGWHADVDDLDNKITTTLQIGLDFGTKEVKAWIWPRH